MIVFDELSDDCFRAFVLATSRVEPKPAKTAGLTEDTSFGLLSVIFHTSPFTCATILVLPVD